MKTSAESRESESDGELPGPFEAQSYDDLLQFPYIQASGISTPFGRRDVTVPLVDAIVVPTIRPAEHLRPAVQFAADTRCHLILVYTDQLPDGLSDVLAGLRPGQVTLLTVRSGIQDGLLDLGASLPPSLVSPAALDISRKRNLGLLIGRVCGWTRMLFLDDDIRKLNVAKLSSAAALLDDYPVVGLQVKKYPAESVVGHARRLTGRRQEPFVSGGSLLVNPQLLNGYFAPVYHEDWLCVINHLRAGEVAIGGLVAQLPYLPFSASKRAEHEEFGDVLLSGLLWLVHARIRKGAADKARLMTETDYWREATNPRFWKQILEQRAALLADITWRLTGKDFDGPSPLPSLAAAKRRLAELTPADLASFTERWLTSLAIWRSRLSNLSSVGLADKARGIEKALAILGLVSIVRIHEVSSQRDATRRDGFTSVWGRWVGADYRRRFGARGVSRDELDETTPSSRLPLSRPPSADEHSSEATFVQAGNEADAPAGDSRARALVEQADQAESGAQDALAQRAFDEAVRLLESAIAWDPARADRLKPDLNCLSKQPGDTPGRLAWRRGLWFALAESSPLAIGGQHPLAFSGPVQPPDRESGHTAAQVTPAAEIVTVTPSVSEGKPRISRKPQKAGDDLEKAFIRLMERFFSLAGDDERAVLDRLRRQRAGLQYGHDVQFDCTPVGKSAVHCHVECKNYHQELKPEHVADKIWQTQRYWDKKKVDYFIIVTPRAGISNELDHLIQTSNTDINVPFQIQVWGPDEGVKEFFALEPLAYEAVYGAEPPPVPDVAAVVARWSERLTPPLRLPPTLKAYLTSPRLHSLSGEDGAHFAALFHDSIEVDAVDSVGSPLGKLGDLLDSWIDDPTRRRFLLLGEFGDGKSFACYRLTRVLASKYAGSPSATHFPIRLPLRDLISAGNPQELLSRRLQALGADMRDWARLQDIGPSLIVLDGFDEMSPQLDPVTIRKNLQLIAECVRYFGESKLIVTSRTHYFESTRMQARFLEQLGQPVVARLAPLSLSKRIKHLHAYAEERGLSDKFERIRRLYDPIGLAGKPLFLQMIKETLPDLPDDYFDEIVLYDTSVRDSLKRKAEMLQDENLHTLQSEAIQGMIELLESVAVELLTNGGEPVDLRTFGTGSLDIARVLWKMTEEGPRTEQTEDARARLGMRSLLKPFPRQEESDAWPVTFCHRSMSEYFVAQAILRALRHHHQKARELLYRVILRPEIVDFAALGVNKGNDAAALAARLADLARSADRDAIPGYVGGNAITIAYRSRWRPSDSRWVGLDLSYADLSGADLADADFTGSSLRHANLDNADLSNADLSNADLTGVRLEETAPVICVAPGQSDSSVLACYGDGTIREWLLDGSPCRPAQAAGRRGRSEMCGLRALWRPDRGRRSDAFALDNL